MGLYVPGVNQPGLELPLLIDGVSYPGVQVYGDYFLRDPLAVDADYTSEFTDLTLGNLPTSINADGGEFIGLYEGHAPEELVNGAEFDTLDMRVYTRPGADWNRDGHGFQLTSIRYIYESAVTDTYSWAGVVENPVQILVSNQTTGLDLASGTDYSVDWENQTITLLTVADGDGINIAVYELGGGNQLYRANYAGSVTGQTVIIPVNSTEINIMAVFVNGEAISGVTWEPYTASINWNILDNYDKLDVVNDSGNYYRAIQAVPQGVAIDDVAYWLLFVPTLESQVDLGSSPGPGSGISLTALGLTTVLAGNFVIGQQYTISTVGTTNFVALGAAVNTVGTVFTATGIGSGTGKATTAYSWSTPQVQYFVVTPAEIATKTFALTNSAGGTNSANMIVTRNGLRLTPPEGIEWLGDDSSVSFGLPQRGGYQQNIINAPTDVVVWVDNILQVQSVGAIVGSYSVTNWTGSNTPGRQVVFTTPPASGSRILITVNTESDFDVVGQSLQIISAINQDDVIAVTTWNDTAQQNALSLVFLGPVFTGLDVSEPYDSTTYDEGAVSGAPGSYDYSAGVLIVANDFYLQRDPVAAGRLWVTLDGYRLFEGADYVVENGYLILATGAIGAAQVLVVTEFTNSIVPEAMAFRVFQDMRGVQATYRITNATTTTLAQNLSATDNIAYVANAAALSDPNLALGIFGAITIDGERIMYRERNTALNTISGLMRGTLGTGASAHLSGAEIYDIGRGNLLPQQYQDYIVSDSTLGDGSTSVFYAPSILFEDFLDSSSERPAVEVYVGGIRQYAYSDTTATSRYRWFVTDYDPLAVDFVVDGNVHPPLEAPPAGVEVTILVRQGVTWYQQGLNQASDGIALQDTDTQAARFLRGF
jgi:hypothetical protein